MLISARAHAIKLNMKMSKLCGEQNKCLKKFIYLLWDTLSTYCSFLNIFSKINKAKCCVMVKQITSSRNRAKFKSLTNSSEVHNLSCFMLKNMLFALLDEKLRLYSWLIYAAKLLFKQIVVLFKFYGGIKIDKYIYHFLLIWLGLSCWCHGK